MNALRLTLVTLVLSSVALAAAPEITSVEATGEAAIVNGNAVKAREEARRAALRNAVEQVAGTLISADTLTENSQLISDRIYSNSAGYVRAFRDVKCTEAGGVSTCTLTADVSRSGLDRDLQAVQQLVRSLPGRKFIVLTQEQAIDPNGVVTSSSVMAAALQEQLQRDGWDLIDPTHANNGRLRLTSGVAIGAPEAKEIGQVTKANYILYGRINFRYQKGQIGLLKGSEVFPLTGEYELTVFETGRGTQLGTVTGKMSNPQGMSIVLSYEQTAHEVSKLASMEIVEQVRKLVYAQLGSAQQNGTRIEVSVKGLGDFDGADAFSRHLSDSVTGVREVQLDGLENGTANFVVTFVGTSNDLAGKVSRAVFMKRKVSVTGLKGNSLELTVGK